MQRAWLLLLLGCLKIASCEEPTLCEPRSPKAGQLFSTDNFPSKYGSNLKCIFNLEAAPGKKVHLTFFVIDLEQNNACQYDSVTVRDTNGTQLHKLCGENQENIEVTSTGNLLTLELKSDSVQEGTGFLASWEEVDDAPTKQEASNGEYMVSHPSSLLISTPEKLCVELFKDQAEAELTVEVFDSSKGGLEPHLFDRSSVVSNEISVAAGSGSGCLEIVVPEFVKGDTAILKISLQIPGSKMVIKYESVKLLKKENYLLVQTDKGQYKAKDTVKFRVLALDHDLRPSEIKSMDEVWIEDPRGRRISQWRDVQLRKGLLQEEMKLSEEPELGTWTINYSWSTSSGSHKEKETFKVSEYVLPKFSVEIKSPPAVLKNDDKAEWMVCAKYTHGGAVKGFVKSNFSSQFSQGWRRPPVLKSITAETNVTADEDCATIQLNRDQLLDLTEKVEFFKLAVEFEEEGTGTVVKEESSASLKDKEILIEAGSSSRDHILGGFPYTGELVVKNHDQSPVVNEEVEVCMRLYKDVREIRNKLNRRGIYGMDEEEIVELGKLMQEIHYATRCHSVTSDESGKVKFHVPLSASLPKDVTKLSIKAKAMNRKADNVTGMKQPELKHDVSLSHEGGDLSLGLLKKEKRALHCNEEFVATVFFSSAAQKPIILHYNAVSKGEIVKSDRMEVTVGGTNAMAALVEGTKELAATDGQGDAASIVSSAEIPLPIDHTVSPSLKLVVFVNEGNTTLTDSHTYKIEGCQQHQVAASWNKAKVYPGSDVTLSVTAEPGSLCALSATDKSVDLLGNKNKITGERMAELREQIGRRKTSQVSFNWKMQNKCPDTFKALKVFEGTGIKIVSDLPFLSQCETVIDANNSDGSVEHEVLNSPVPVAFAAPSGAGARSRYRPGVRGSGSMRAEMMEAEMDALPSEISPSLMMKSSSSGGRKFSISEPKVILRSLFPETWLFDLFDIGEMPLRQLTAPDTITTWNAEAVCVNNEAGLGVAKPAALLVSQDFFAELRLPYSVKRGESFPLNVTIFNYIDAQLPIEVTIQNEAGDLKMENSVHQLCIEANNNEVISVDTEALKLGEVNVTVEATIKSRDGCNRVSEGEGFKDALVKPLRVKAEGVPVEKVESDFKCFESGQEAFTLSNLETPKDIVEGSERAWVYLTGDIMGPALENVGNLVRLPTGCGEQNMVGLVPNIYLLQYLEGTGQKNAELEEKAKEYMRIGYRRQAKYNHPNGAYSIWGDKGDKDGSSWLTAFVVKSFSEAAEYIEVESGTLQRSVDWLMQGQMENGCFPKRGYVHSSYLKGGGRDSSLTPFIVTALLQAATSPKLDIKINYKRLAEGVDCMMGSLNESDKYASILTAHSASLLANKLGGDLKTGFTIDPKTEEKAVNLLDKLVATANTSLPDAKFWEIKRKETPCRWYWGCRASSEAVEMTAYMIQSLVLRGRAGDAVDSVKWLGKQRNSRGGFVSTQDTVVALQALSMYSQNITSIPLDMTVTVSHSSPSEVEDATELGVFSMSETDKLLLRRQTVLDLPSKLTVETKGSGCAMVQTVLRYNTPEAQENSGFTLTAAQEGSDLNVCGQYTGSQSETGMVVMEVEMVSGWEARFSEIESLVNDVNYEIQRVERGKEDKDNVVLYFDSWPREELCVTLPLKQDTIINEVKPAAVSLYDYYNTDDKATVLYSLK